MREHTRFGERAVLLAWREPGARAWDADDLTLAGSIAGVVRIVLEHEAIQRELARQARTDPLTGLLNRRAFLDEATRRVDRLERDGLPGTLLFVDLDRLKQVNDRLGHEVGDSALVLTAGLLTRTFRPGDLVARLEDWSFSESAVAWQARSGVCRVEKFTNTAKCSTTRGILPCNGFNERQYLTA